MSISAAQFASPYAQSPAMPAPGRFSATKQAEMPAEEALEGKQAKTLPTEGETAVQEPSQPLDTAAEAETLDPAAKAETLDPAAKAALEAQQQAARQIAELRAQNQQLYAGLKSDLEAMGPVGGSRSYRTKSNGDVVILNNQRTIIPQTGIKTVDRVSKEITPTVDTTTSVVGDVIASITRGITYGGIVGGILGFMIKATAFIPSKQFKKLGLTMAGFAMAGAMLGATLQGVRAILDGAKKVTQSVNGLIRGTLKPQKK